MKRMVLFSCLILMGCHGEALSGTHQNGGALSIEAADTIESPVSGEIKNLERFQRFLTNFNQKESDRIQLIHYTVEGDPIFQELAYDGDVIKTTIDSSEDAYGSGEIWSTVCGEVKEKKTTKGSEYVLRDCEDLEENLLFVVSEK
ncbi:DUF4362 domain-containing protein [Planococcus sp. YIM B11945]|uniref:DUF4362 domain-containing protein n=1 Tax=Planococcus sp. YIM B11945 TaxID=3435410 RepID=UPI003D7ED153